MAARYDQCANCNKRHPPTVLSQSPFQALITQPVLPSALQVAGIRDFVHEMDAELSRKELAIAATQASLDELLCEHAELSRTSQKHKAFIAPIRRIPPELIAEIFTQSMALEARAFETDDSDSFYGSEGIGAGDKYYIVTPRVQQPPLIFGEICRDWRLVALSTPRFWNSLTLKCAHSSMQANLHLLETWVKRAGNLPLSFRLYQQVGSDTPQTIEMCRKLIQSLMPYAHRWRWLDLHYLPTAAYQVLGALFVGCVQQLEYISVIHTSQSPQIEFSSPWESFQIAPKLHDLHFDCISAAGIRVDAERPTFPWSQLTRIDVGDCSPHDCLHILAQASAATFCIFLLTQTSTSTQPPFVHSQLQTLKIKSYVNMQPFWSTITCSALSTLSVELHSMGAMGSHDFPQFIARCSGSIGDLTLCESGINDTEFIACLGQMPRLRSLYVSDFGVNLFTNMVGKALTLTSAIESASRPLLPQLESFTLSGGRWCSDKCLARMLESRIPSQDDPQRPMKKLSLYICRKMSDEIYRRIWRFKKCGVVVDLDLDYNSGDSSNEVIDSDSEDDDDDSSNNDHDSDENEEENVDSEDPISDEDGLTQ
ncbi:hypothetical protein DFH06DRAFT_1288884 [Mycena polygramma]|nr:hypothetical protein DFH06DRAFT_1288884 [Mycena polygramma]